MSKFASTHSLCLRTSARKADSSFLGGIVKGPTTEPAHGRPSQQTLLDTKATENSRGSSSSSSAHHHHHRLLMVLAMMLTVTLMIDADDECVPVGSQLR